MTNSPGPASNGKVNGRVTGAATLYQAVSKAMDNPGVNSVHHLWDAQSACAEPSHSPG